MALYFSKKRRWPPERPVQFMLAFLVLLIAISVMVAWIFIGFRQEPSHTNEDSSAPMQDSFTASIDRCLLIFDFGESKRFVLIQTDPTNYAITTAAVPPETVDGNGDRLDQALTGQGAPKATQVVASALQVSVDHYILMTAGNLQEFLSVLDNGITFTLPEAIRYTDENGVSISLAAQQQKLTAAQATAVLQYSQWAQTDSNTISAQMVCAVFNQYLSAERRFDGYFSALANASVTDLRIDNFNAFRAALTRLATKNDGEICHSVALKGVLQENGFVPDVDAMRNTVPFYID